jgi:hypothetical protein
MHLFPPIVLLILGGIAVLLAIGGFVFSMLSFFRARDIRMHGKLITAIVTKINMEYVLFTRGGYTTSFFVYADWEDPETHKIYHFKSDAGGAYLPINHPPGSSIDVLIDPRNPRRYEVQLKFEERSYV